MKIASIDRNERLFSIGTICDTFALKKDAYYKNHERSIIKNQTEKDVIGLVRESRRTLPREDFSKLMRSLENNFIEYNLKVFGHQLFPILR